jgi:UPF0755 protein
MYLKKILLATVLLGLLATGAFAYFVYHTMFAPNTAFNNEQAIIYIPSDSEYEDVIEILNPLLKDLSSFQRLAVKKQYHQNIKPGKYAIQKDMGNNDIINTIRSRNLPLKVTFNNQQSIQHLSGRIANQIEADSIELLSVFLDKTFLKTHDLSEQTVLSICIPNTYEFYWNTNALDFRERMFQEYDNFWNENRLGKLKQKSLTRTQAIILASIVQKETTQNDEKPRVAGVYLNRLKKDMKLQADPTVVYAIKQQTKNYDTIIKRVLYKDLEIDSPYNTYKNFGLPPGPIAMPDISSIEAVLNAEQHSYYYFVADTKRLGYHKFAKTLRQHNANKAVYVKWLQQQNIKR